MSENCMCDVTNIYVSDGKCSICGGKTNSSTNSLTQEVKELRQEMSCPFCAESVIRGEDGEAIPLQNKAVLEQATRAEQAEQQRDDYREALEKIASTDAMDLMEYFEVGPQATSVERIYENIAEQALQQEKG